MGEEAEPGELGIPWLRGPGQRIASINNLSTKRNGMEWHRVEWNTHKHTQCGGGGGDSFNRSTARAAFGIESSSIGATGHVCWVDGLPGRHVGWHGRRCGRRVRSLFGVSTRAARYRNCDPQSIQQERSPFTRQLIAGQRHGDAWHRRLPLSTAPAPAPAPRLIMAWLAVAWGGVLRKLATATR